MACMPNGGEPKPRVSPARSAPPRNARPAGVTTGTMSACVARSLSKEGRGTMPIISFPSRRGPLILQRFDEPYLDRLRSGDPETERDFVAYFSKLILIKLRSRVRSAQVVEDIRQETFLRAFRALRAPDGIRSAGGLGAFVNSICNNVLFESLRSHKRHPQ